MNFAKKTSLILALIMLGSANAGTTATWTTYADAACTTLCPAGTVDACSTTVDTTQACNQNSESSQSNIVCYADKITYTNFPNTGTNSGSAGCPSGGQSFPNEIAVGGCIEFPGPVLTWKKIEASTYDCEDNSGGPSAGTPTAAPGDDTPSSAMKSSIVASMVLPLLFFAGSF
eukprot:CAMPEP_0113619160 /NCGR_PEP_ID=MMETSP0017_2-20120614/9720_1 /TAXON_ID=2856 /ORGANISM="Cylindrotheca closterium" /LENGTH=172 /DNA_ID=CAMNT_0000528713 /DNA_START=25 /DNA_END=543 /DNA_ORIENTATION=- /assembly_acc=CAM_ASM_000147